MRAAASKAFLVGSLGFLMAYACAAANMLPPSEHMSPAQKGVKRTQAAVARGRRALPFI